MVYRPKTETLKRVDNAALWREHEARNGRTESDPELLLATQRAAWREVAIEPDYIEGGSWFETVSML
jgi:hypothetical protein